MSSSTSPKRTPLPKSYGKIIGGRLDLSNKGLTHLKDIGVQPNLEVLILSNNNLKTFETLQPQPNLTTIIADNNPIEFLNGLDIQPKLNSLDITDSPLTLRNKFAYYTLATIGPNLLTLNGKTLTRDDQTAADIIKKRKPELLYFGTVEEDEEEVTADSEQLKQIQEVYAKEHQQFFLSFAYNDAVLFDLEKSGPLPFIDKFSTEDEISAAIKNIRDRNEMLRQKVNELSGLG
ncbi:hypothetical protein TRFO_31275 [Tritrichomonas foetus]|uniref:Leucine Rich Repeat family protein n=1 Tax=Tritrichomonas foetus TaxID=1144522 RepID=A0A1J4JSL9_9EUKA|nr:hypothetical protein TRFO_31275 [Tritrichomonas foetus]|eukprot:OHT01762.1 hypothetical protein TRFO_31275 [Tritrichomonas foetus]